MDSFSDFTLNNYRLIINLCQQYGYEFIGYDSELIKEDKKQILLRHDVDYSMRRAVKLAEIEKEEGVKATYFIFSHSEGYNLYEAAVMEMVHKIIDLGHDIGLHVDYGIYEKCIRENKSVEKVICKEIEDIQKTFACKVTSISFHQPENFRGGIKLSDWEMAGTVNAYSEYIFENYKYCSDSNGYWRFDRLEDVINSQKYKKLQILLHPVWWTEESCSPAEKMWRYYNDEAEIKYHMYCIDMKKCGRINIGEEKLRFRNGDKDGKI